VMSFDSWSEMQEKLGKMRTAANEGLAAAQKAVTYGDYWVRFYKEFTIFGRVMPLDEYMASEVSLGAPPEEAEYTAAHVQRAHDEGMMWGMAYSVLEPEGELGNTHRANLWPIEERVFNAARDAEWDPERFPEWVLILLQEAARAWRSHIKEHTR
jgi:hypothetical protein